MSSMYAERVGFSARFAALVLTGPALNAINTTMIAVALVPVASATDVRVPRHLARRGALPGQRDLPAHDGEARQLVRAREDLPPWSDNRRPRQSDPLLSASFGGALASRVALGIGTSSSYRGDDSGQRSVAALAQQGAAGCAVTPRICTPWSRSPSRTAPTRARAASRCPRAGRSQARMPDAWGCKSEELAAGFSCSPVNDQVPRRWRGLRRR